MDETVGGSEGERSQSGIRFWIPALIAGTSMFLGVLDTSMMNVAVPVIVRDLGTTVSAMHGAIAVYSMVMAALIVPGGALRAVLDTRRLLVGALCLYGVGTFVAGISPNMATLFVGWSIIEGIAAAFLLPIAFSIVTENYEGATRAKAFGAIGAAGAAGAALGPMIGGVLTTFASWRWGMFGELILVLGLLGLTRSLPSKSSNREVAFDVGGTVLSILGVVAIVAGSVLAGRYGWVRPLRPFVIGGREIEPLGLSPAAWCLGLGALCLVGFVQHETRRAGAGRPLLIPIDVFRNRTFAAGSATFAAESLFLAGFMFVVPVYLQSALGFSAFRTGLALLPYSLATVIVATISTGWRRYLPPKYLVQAGLVCMAVGLLALIGRVGPELTISDVILPMAVIGIGLGLFTGQLVDLTMSAVETADSSVASGVINSVSQLGYALGTAIAGSFLLARFYGGVVDGVSRVVGGTGVTGDARRRLAVRLEDGVDATTPAQQRAFVEGLGPESRETIQGIIEAAMTSAQKSALALVVGFVLLTLLASSALPAMRAASETETNRKETENTRSAEGGDAIDEEE